MTSYNFGPLETTHSFEEISLSVEQIVIDDSHMFNHTRSTEIINVSKTRVGFEPLSSYEFAPGTESRELINQKMLVMFNVGKLHTRVVTASLDVIAASGGLFYMYQGFALLLYAVIG